MKNLLRSWRVAFAMALLGPGLALAGPNQDQNSPGQSASLSRKDFQRERAAYRASLENTPREERRKLMQEFDATHKIDPAKKDAASPGNARAAYRKSLQGVPREQRRKLMQEYKAKQREPAHKQRGSAGQ